MRIEVSITVSVHEDSNLIGCDREYQLQEVEEYIYNALYDIDDIVVEEMETKRAD